MILGSTEFFVGLPLKKKQYHQQYCFILKTFDIDNQLPNFFLFITIPTLPLTQSNYAYFDPIFSQELSTSVFPTFHYLIKK